MILGWVTVVLSALNLIGGTNWVLVANANLGEMYFYLHCATIFALLVLFVARRGLSSSRRVRWLFVFSLLGAMYYGIIMVRFLLPQHRTEAGERLSLTSIFLDDSASQCEYLNRILSPSPDGLVAILNLRSECQMASHLATHTVIRSRLDGWGFGVWSAQPLTLVSESAGEFVPPILQVQLEPKTGVPTSLILFRALEPFSSEAAETNKLLFRRIASVARNNHQDVVMIGKMYQSPFSVLYKKFVDGAEAVNAQEGFGWVHTSGGGFPYIGTPLDHVFFKGNLQVINHLTTRTAGHLIVNTVLSQLP